VRVECLAIAQEHKTRQDKTRQLYLTRVAQSAARLVSLGALGSIKLTYMSHNVPGQGSNPEGSLRKRAHEPLGHCPYTPAVTTLVKIKRQNLNIRVP